MASKSKALLINVSAFELLQLREILMRTQVKGIRGGVNTEIISVFGSALGIYEGTYAAIVGRIQVLTSYIEPEIGNLASTSMFRGMEINNTQLYVTFRKLIEENTTGMFNHFEKLSPNLEYAPINKFLSMISGTGRPQSNIQASERAFRDVVIADRSTTVCLDGNDLLLIMKENAPGRVMVPVELRRSRFHYSNVNRVNSMFGVDHVDAGLSNLRLTINGVTDGITSSGILDLSNEIAFEGKNTATILRFIGTLQRPIDRNAWNGTYLGNDFDYDVFVRAFTKLAIDMDDLQRFNEITPIWLYHIENEFINRPTKTALAGYDGIGIFSPGCMTTIAADASYNDGKASQGKKYMANVLSTLYSICVFLTMHQYFK